MRALADIRDRNIGDGVKPQYGFVITKPLQLMVVLSIIGQLEESCAVDFLIVDNFSGAKDVQEKMERLVDKNSRVFYFRLESLAFRFVLGGNYRKLFIDSDVGFRRNLDLVRMAIFRPATSLAVYEEGLGSYRTDLYTGFRKQVLRMMGCGVFFGGNWRTKEIYLFQPEKCTTPISATKIQIRESISELLRQKWDFLCMVFNATDYVERVLLGASSSRECVIYLTSWVIEEQRIADLCVDGKTVIVKPHPHIKKVECAGWQPRISVAPASLPAEIIIVSAAKVFEQVTVLHHGSSVDRYLNIGNVKFKRVC